ncbi:MAG: site-specific DNA-methyltransferase [Monoglobus pectinilyticus]|uniref:site-specific DNA-methyltransferase n=2 Tax=Monoglobus pectinilyticus TaxID=1981510 RepID=UPI002A74BACF|nr:site-specific DNA-methyltransferase [Monoglobus pectinilyticus]
MDKNILDGLSMDLENSNMEKLKTVFPECFSEGKLDIDKLLSLCGEYIDNDFEKYKFEWKGKSECLHLAQKRSTGTLRPCREESVNFDDTNNVYIEGDNLEVLKLLQTAYYNKVKMIYIDPPYNTGNDFVYEDDFADPMARYKEITEQTTKSNPETMGRFHTNWLNMMYPRLRLAANLLRDDGVIFISIDDNEVFNLKKVCDEVFGEENFIDCLHWKKKKQPSFLAKHTAKLMEYVLVYGKNADQLEKLSIETLSDATKKVINISNQECVRHFSKGVRVKIGENGIIKAGRYKIKTMEVEYLQDVYYENGVTINEVDVVSKFSVSQEKIDQFIKDNLLFITENSGLRRDVSEEEKKKRKSITDLLLSEYGDNQESDNEQKDLFGNKYFDYTKPVKLVYNLTKSLIYNEDDIILDFFSGSATTAHAVMQLNAEDGGNRRFICVQLPELCDEKSEAYKAGYKNICEIGKERIRRAGKKIIEEKGDQIGIDDEEKKPLDIGFKVFKLDTSNLRIWDNTPITGDNQIEMFTERMNSMIDSIKDDRTDMDVVYEVMLKMGVPLDVPVQYIGVNEKVVYKVVYKVVHIVGDFLLMIALFDNITAEDIEAIAEYAPAKIICAEHGFADDSALSNAHYILKDRQIELKLI